MQQEIKVGSVTNAQRGAKILRSNGISTSVSRLEHPGTADGCGFALRVDASDSERSVELLRRYKIRIIGDEVL
ncbi:MAG: hypothetical protein SPH20_06420 [Eubacterium sp.]|nr:hypothetical protein [Eubacterium sp.]